MAHHFWPSASAMDSLGILGRALSRQPYCSIVLTEGERGDEGDSGNQSANGKDSANESIIPVCRKCTHVRRLLSVFKIVSGRV